MCLNLVLKINYQYYTLIYPQLTYMYGLRVNVHKHRTKGGHDQDSYLAHFWFVERYYRVNKRSAARFLKQNLNFEKIYFCRWRFQFKTRKIRADRCG